ncbi:MAG: protoporphyrinogen oxidase, partial [Phycisphaerae bacterium]|nr:protoporphyrinogen oxidase [Phycisphaerae bacterium]
EAHRRALVVRRGRLMPIPAGFRLMAPGRWGPVLRSPLFSWRGKLRMAGERFVPRKSGGEDEAVADFVVRRFGREALERLVQPLVGGIYTADANRLSLRATLPQFGEMEQQYGSVSRGMRERAVGAESDDAGARYSLFLSFEDGMQTLVDGLVGNLNPVNVELGRTACAVRRGGGGGWEVHCEDGGVLDGDGVILALPAFAAADLLGDCDAELAASLASIEYASSAVINLGFNQADVPDPLEAFGFVVPAAENRRLLAASYSSSKYAGRAPADHVLLRAFVGGALQPELLEYDDEKLIGLAREELGELLGIGGEPVITTVARWPRSMPQYTVGHRERVESILGQLAAHDGLGLAGSAYDGVGIPDCIRSGQAAAEGLF